MTKPNAEQPRPMIMWVLTPVVIVFALFMFISFDSDEWTTPRVIGQVAFSLVAFGMLVTTVAPTRGWWGIRLVTFVIFAGYFFYLIDQFVIQSNSLEPTVSRSATSPFNALLGFLFFGIPCLLYSLWGSTWGSIGRSSEKATKTDIVSYYIAWGAQVLFLALSLFSVIYVIWKWYQQ